MWGPPRYGGNPSSGNPPQRKAGQETGVVRLGVLHPCNGRRMGMLQFGCWGARLHPGQHPVSPGFPWIPAKNLRSPRFVPELGFKAEGCREAGVGGGRRNLGCRGGGVKAECGCPGELWRKSPSSAATR